MTVDENTQKYINYFLTFMGGLSVTSYFVVGIGDFLIRSFDKIAKKTLTDRDDKFALWAANWWETAKELWGELRDLAVKTSAFTKEADFKKKKDDLGPGIEK